MAGFNKRHGAGSAIILVGITFLIIGFDRRAHGGSSAFLVIGMAFIFLGIRRIRRGRANPGGMM